MSAYAVSARGLAGRKVPQGVLTPMGDLLFSASEPGAWYDPSDLSTLFQDSAGTVPVTAVEQPVGRVLDKSGRGNHAIQATTTKRPVLSARYNLLTKSEDFTDAVWIKSSGGGIVSVQPNVAVAPNGSLTASKIIANAVSALQIIYANGYNSTAVPLAIKIRAKKAEYKFFRIFHAFGNVAVFDLDDGSFVKTGTNFSNISASYIGDGWWECSVTSSGQSSSYVGFSFAPVSITYGFAGDNVSGGYIWGASITLATDAHLPYQRVNTATDYDADPSKFPAYLRFDGVDDALQTGNIDFTGTDKMTVWAGVTKLSDAAPQAIAELGNSPSTLAGTFWINANSLAPGDIWSALASSVSARTGRSFLAPSPSIGVLSTAYEFAGATREYEIKPRWNGAVPVLTGGLLDNAGSGPFGTHPLYIGARAGTNLYFSGRIYSLIVRGAQTPLSQIEATELYIKQKMRMP